jgi:hypothetical protein
VCAYVSVRVCVCLCVCAYESVSVCVCVCFRVVEMLRVAEEWEGYLFLNVTQELKVYLRLKPV